jgi:hypothetical protein
MMGLRGETGPRGVAGSAGPPGPPGPAGSGGGFGAAQLQALFQPGPKGPAAAASAAASDEPAFEIPKELRNDETLKAFVDVAEVIKKTGLKSGTKDNPAETCRDLALQNPELPNGMYWIDPNGGNSNDAIEVYCNIAKHETCVEAKPSGMDKGKYFPLDGRTGAYKWFSTDLRDGKSFTYKADSSQMRFLRHKSSVGTQSITYHCNNAIGVYDASTNTYDYALKLLGDNDVEITHNGIHGKSYTVDYDNCKNQMQYSRWARTKVTFKTSRTDRLPIVDLATFQINRDMEFGIYIGKVCFS